MADVFLSYAREDRARAEQVARGLEAAGGDVFWDNEIPPGQSWADYIEGKLAQCKAQVVLWSEHSTKSQWVREEARMGRDKGVLIPVQMDAAAPPFGFGEVQAANLAAWTGAAEDPNWQRFVAAVQRVLSATPAVATMAPTVQPAAPQAWASAPVSPPPKRGVPMWAWIAGGVVGAVVVLGAIVAMLPDQTPPQPAVADAPSPPAQGDASPQAIILAQLQQAQAALTQQGFQMVGQPYSGGLQQGESWNVAAELHTGFDYRVIGVCDRDCADMDLVLFDQTGRALIEDRSTDSQPVLSVQPSYSGGYTIQVQMYRCSVAPCYYAIALYGRAL